MTSADKTVSEPPTNHSPSRPVTVRYGCGTPRAERTKSVVAAMPRLFGWIGAPSSGISPSTQRVSDPWQTSWPRSKVSTKTAPWACASSWISALSDALPAWVEAPESYVPELGVMLHEVVTLDSLPRESPPVRVRVEKRRAKRRRRREEEEGEMDDWDVVSTCSEESFCVV